MKRELRRRAYALKRVERKHTTCILGALVSEEGWSGWRGQRHAWTRQLCLSLTMKHDSLSRSTMRD
eukprot:6180898-Pleurochrysis_carterae.AAC.2